MAPSLPALTTPTAGPPSTDGSPRRYGRRTRAKRISTSLWPDAYARLLSHAHTHQLTPSGAVHDILRRFFKLPLDC
jgi:hypothetical protein